MTSWMLNITFDCREPALVARFWAGVTGWPLQQQDDTPGHEEFSVGPPAGAELPAGGPRLYFVSVPEPKTVKNRVHLDIVPSSGSQEEEIARLVSLGATVLNGQPPGAGWVIMADPEGNEFDLEYGEDLPGLEAPQVGDDQVREFGGASDAVDLTREGRPVCRPGGPLVCGPAADYRMWSEPRLRMLWRLPRDVRPSI